MIKGIAHIGFCVKSIEAVLEFYRKTVGATEVSRIPMPEMQQVSSYVSIGMGQELFELMEPLGNTGTVADFLAKRGEGIHHISLKTDNLNEAISSFEEAGCRIIGRGENYAFVHPKTSFGVLYELVEG